MSIRTVRQTGDEILRKNSKEITELTPRLKELISDMKETMNKLGGVGLAAVQVGILKRIIVIDVEDENIPIVKLINPVIVKTKGKRECEEGCLSFPNKFAKVVRPVEVVVEGLNENGEKVRIKATELLAQALCHEIDHLNGITFVDIMEPDTLQYVDPNN